MRTLFVLSLLAGLSFPLFAQTKEEAKVNVKKAAKDMGMALVKRDYSNFVITTYPAAIPEGRTTDDLIKELDLQIKQMEKEGTIIMNVWPGEPSKFIDTAGELQCTIPQKMTMKQPEGKLTTETILIALSPDNGKTWYFMDTADRNIGRMRSMFPNISSKLVIPAYAEPTFQPDKK